MTPPDHLTYPTNSLTPHDNSKLSSHAQSNLSTNARSSATTPLSLYSIISSPEL